MQEYEFKIESNKQIAPSVYEMHLQGRGAATITKPGQFINIALDDKFLRRPISVCDATDTTLTIIYKVVGSGTSQMSNMQPGKTITALVPLGNGYDINCTKNPLLVGGGVGVPPMYLLAKRLLQKNCTPTVILGFNTKQEIFYEDEFKALGCNTIVTTADGSYGTKGFVTDALAGLTYDHVFACGPEPMLKALYGAIKTEGQFSFEARMGCGFGACMGCSCKTITGNIRICKEGPVISTKEIAW